MKKRNIDMGGAKALGGESEVLYRILSEVRRCFQQQTRLASKIHADIGLNISHRAILEFLVTQGPESVPQMARAKSVSRQHVQNIVNDLLMRQWVIASPNPKHKKSPLFRPSVQGTKLFRSIQEKEVAPLEQISGKIPVERMAQALTTIEKINQEFENKLGE